MELTTDGGTRTERIHTSTSHPAGVWYCSGFNLSGNKFLDWIEFNEAGNIKDLRVRELNLADIKAAPDSGSSKYIQNQVAMPQTASAWISGKLTTRGGLESQGTASAVFNEGAQIKLGTVVFQNVLDIV